MKQERERALIKDKIQPNFEPCIGETVQPHHTDRTLEKQTCSLLLLLSSPHQLACLITEGWGSGIPPVRSTLLSPLRPSQHIRKCNVAIHSCIKQSDSFKEASQYTKKKTKPVAKQVAATKKFKMLWFLITKIYSKAENILLILI